jgi:nucleotide-binding universal stress UspA family protein
VLSVDDQAPGIEAPDETIAAHLTRHGIRVTVENAASGDVDAATLMLNRAAELSTDLLVIGGYGHSRLREWVLGGVTRRILREMTLPVLMSH